MDRNAQRQRTWIPPLPQGWEGRYDHTQRRYFFINHETKQTQWDDPRFSSRPSTGSGASASSASSTRLSHATAQARPKEHIPMRDLSPRHGSHANQGSHHQQEESSLTRELNTVVINNLHREFPKATKELITDMYHLCHENERETREQLNDLGFIKDSGSRHHQSQPQQQQQQQHRQQPAEPQRPPQPASEPEPSESKKRQLTNQLKVQFPKLDPDVVTIALTTCNYRMEETKRLLQAWVERQSPPKTTSASTSSAGASSSAAVSASLEPAALPGASENSPRALSVGPSSTQSITTEPIQTERGRNTVAGPSRAERVASGSQHLKASDVTKKRSATAPRKKQTVVTSQPTSGGHATSPSHRTSAKGPDANLRKGPDSSLLITDYEPAQGPDRSLRQGPDRGRAFGPLGAKGSDPSLRCGPQSSLLQKHGAASIRMVETHI